MSTEAPPNGQAPDLPSSRSAILDALRSILASEFELDTGAITESSHLVDDLDLDSIDSVAIVVRIEEELDVTISDAQLEDLRTVGDVVDVVSKAQGRS